SFFIGVDEVAQGLLVVVGRRFLDSGEVASVAGRQHATRIFSSHINSLPEAARADGRVLPARDAPRFAWSAGSCPRSPQLRNPRRASRPRLGAGTTDGPGHPLPPTADERPPARYADPPPASPCPGRRSPRSSARRAWRLGGRCVRRGSC